jgi:cytidyltransferase-like protein
MNIWTNGCYDILHIGHIRLMKYAKSLGSQLIVGIDSDNRIKKNKSPDRPYYTQEIRKEFLESIKYVDNVYIFDNESDALSIMDANNISLIIIGKEYQDTYILGGDKYPVRFFDRIEPYSTTNILRNINDKY